MRWLWITVAALFIAATALMADEVCNCANSCTQLPSDASLRSLTTRFTYKAVISEVPKGAKELAVWVPVPSNSPWQTVKGLTVESPNTATAWSMSLCPTPKGL